MILTQTICSSLTGMFLAAMLYSSVGHAVVRHLALMALFSIPAAVMRPTALALNILVASIVSARFALAGLFRWRVLWPFLIGAVPLAFFGGSIHLPGNLYRPIVGVVLLVAAARLLLPQKLHLQETVDPPVIPAILAGGAIGFLSGLTGTGGGNLPFPAHSVHELGGNTDDFRCCRSIHPLQFHSWAFGQSPGCWIAAPRTSLLCRSCCDWRHCRHHARRQAPVEPIDTESARRGLNDRGIEIGAGPMGINAFRQRDVDRFK